MMENKDDDGGSNYDRGRRNIIEIVEHENEHKNNISQDEYRFQHKNEFFSQRNSQAIPDNRNFHKNSFISKRPEENVTTATYRNEIQKNRLVDDHRFGYNERINASENEQQQPQQQRHQNTFGNHDYSERFIHNNSNNSRRSRSISPHKITTSEGLIRGGDNKNWLQFGREDDQLNNSSNFNNSRIVAVDHQRYLSRKRQIEEFIDAHHENMNKREKFPEFRQQEKFYPNIMDNSVRNRGNETIRNNNGDGGGGGGRGGGLFNVMEENFGRNFMEEQNRNSLNFNIRVNRGRSQFFGGRGGGSYYRGINRGYERR